MLDPVQALLVKQEIRVAIAANFQDVKVGL